jgi:hypothetical protein
MKCLVCGTAFFPGNRENRVTCGSDKCRRRYSNMKRREARGLPQVAEQEDRYVFGKELDAFISRHPARWVEVWGLPSTEQAAHHLDRDAVDVLP